MVNYGNLARNGLLHLYIRLLVEISRNYSCKMAISEKNIVNLASSLKIIGLSAFLLLICISGKSQNATIGNDYNSGVEVFEDFFNNPIILIRFQKRSKQREYLVNKGDQEKLEKFDRELEDFKKEVYHSFSIFPASIAMFYAIDDEEVLNGDYSSVQNLDGDPVEIEKGRPIFILNPYQKSSSAFNSGFSACVLLSVNGKELKSPFPNYILKRDGVGFLRRTHSEMATIWLDRIKSKAYKFIALETE